MCQTICVTFAILPDSVTAHMS